jgi:flagellin-like protein
MDGKRSDRGVSSVVGTILVVAIVVLLAGVVGTFLSNMDRPEERPQFTTSVTKNVENYEYASKGMMAPGGGVSGDSTWDKYHNWSTEFIVSHTAGDKIKPRRLHLQMGQTTVKPICTETGGKLSSKLGRPVKDKLPDNYTAGDDIFMYPYATDGDDLEDGMLTGFGSSPTSPASTEMVKEARVVWTSDNDQTSATIETISFTNPVKIPRTENPMFDDLNCFPPIVIQ